MNRLYYACFHAAQAVLYAKGFDPTSHRGVSTLFGKEVVLEEEVPRDDGRFLSELWDYREQADYGYDTLDVDPHSTFVPLDGRVYQSAQRINTPWSGSRPQRTNSEGSPPPGSPSMTTPWVAM